MRENSEFDNFLERKKKIYEVGWKTFLYLIRNKIEPLPENYAKYFKKFLEEFEKEENPIKTTLKRTEELLNKTQKSLGDIEYSVRDLFFQQEIKSLLKRDFLEESYLNEENKPAFRLEKILERLIKNIDSGKVNLEQIKKELKKLEEEIETIRKDKYIDPLTGVWNRLALEEYIQILPSLCLERNVIVAFIDLNKFKEINDKYGHRIGDIILKKFAQFLKENLKRKDFIARYGGDEFVVFLFDIDLLTAKRLFEKLRKSFPPIEINGKKIKIDFCVGLTVPFGNDTPEEIIKRADKAMYKCKKTNKVEIELK
jgi:diguanylate cyclase (GGDEF)-like protein